MSTESRTSLPTEAEGKPGLTPRIFALTALVGVGSSLLWLVIAVVQVFTDSWIAPIELSPDSDAVLQMDLQLTRQRAEMDRVEAELARIEAEIGAIDAGLSRLELLRNRSESLFSYGAEISTAEEESLRRGLRTLQSEREILGRLIARQEQEVARAQGHLEAGIIERRDLEREEQTLDGLRLQLVANARTTEEAELQRQQADRSARQLRDSAAGGHDGRMPEIVQRHEAETRLELEILRLQAEKRGLMAMRDVGRRSLTELQQVMHEIEARPLYQATQHHMEVAFVPYEQLDGVQEGARLLQCEAGIFFCRDVGRIAQVMAGEVVTQDPWGELARGRYAVLALDDLTAVQERILRVR